MTSPALWCWKRIRCQVSLFGKVRVDIPRRLWADLAEEAARVGLRVRIVESDTVEIEL